jgi:hypothetical protein
MPLGVDNDEAATELGFPCSLAQYRHEAAEMLHIWHIHAAIAIAG